MDEKRSEGVVLKATPYKENDRIITLFTPDQGVISLYVRGLSRSKPALVNLTTPLCHGEFIYRKGKSDLYRFVDGTIIDLHLPLRRSYQHLEFGGKMLQAILKSQLPGKAAEKLYALLLTYLKHLPTAEHPAVLWVSFLLKLLKHEGLLSLTESCTSCGNPASRFGDGESRCSECDEGLSFPFSEEEWKLLYTLGSTRQFTNINHLTLDLSLVKATEALYDYLANQG